MSDVVYQIYKFSDLMDKWMRHKGRLTTEEEDELGMQLLEISNGNRICQNKIYWARNRGIREDKFEKNIIFHQKIITGILFIYESIVFYFQKLRL